MHSAVQSRVGEVVQGSREEIDCRIVIHGIEADGAAAVAHVEGAIEVVPVHKTAELAACEYIAQVFVALIQHFVVAVYGIRVSSRHIIHYIVHAGKEVIVYLVSVIPLHAAHIQFMCHAVGHEAGIAAYFRGCHRCQARHCAHQRQQGYPYCPYTFHSCQCVKVSLCFH